MLRAGDRAPSFALPDIDTAEPVSDPWGVASGHTVLAFFKTTCPVCQMVAPKLGAMASTGAEVVGIGEDPPPVLAGYRDKWSQGVTTLSEAPPYEVSFAFGLTSVPTLYLVGQDGTIVDAIRGWDRDEWNRLAVAAGAQPVSTDGDGLPPFRPG